MGPHLIVDNYLAFKAMQNNAEALNCKSQFSVSPLFAGVVEVTQASSGAMLYVQNIFRILET